jgi:hypothetical protein
MLLFSSSQSVTAQSTAQLAARMYSLPAYHCARTRFWYLRDLAIVLEATKEGSSPLHQPEAMSKVQMTRAHRASTGPSVIALTMEAASTSEMSAGFYQTTRHNPEINHLKDTINW